MTKKNAWRTLALWPALAMLAGAFSACEIPYEFKNLPSNGGGTVVEESDEPPSDEEGRDESEGNGSETEPGEEA